MKTFSIFYIFLALYFQGCAELEPEEEPKQVQKPNKPVIKVADQQYIDDINNIIDQISSYNINNKHDDFIEHNLSGVSQSKVIFLGEDHTKGKRKIANIAMLNQHFRKGDKILLEGGIPFQKSNCHYNFLSHIYSAKKYKLTNQPYEPYEFAKFKEELNRKFMKVSSKLKLSSFSFEKDDCFHWDNQGKPGIDRNKAMVRVINTLVKNNIRVFVVTGAAHIPEYYLWHRNRVKSKNIKDVKELFLNHTDKDPYLEDVKPIFNFLDNNKYDYTVVMPKKLFYKS